MVPQVLETLGYQVKTFEHIVGLMLMGNTPWPLSTQSQT